MKRARNGHTTPNKDLKILLQFGIRKKVQIRLVKLKLDVNVRVTKLNLKSVKTKLKSKSCQYRPVKVQIPVLKRCHTKIEEIKKKQFNCHLCNYSGAKRNYLPAHLRIHSDKRTFKCTLCSYQGLRLTYLKKHLRTHQVDNSFTCQFCTQKFSSPSNKSTHEKRCRQNPMHSDAKWLDENKRYKCHLCNYASWIVADLREHLRRHFGQKPFSCNLCTYNCTTQRELNSHVFTHTREKPFKCLQCDYLTSSMSNLKSHTKIRHSNEIRNRNFSCNLCPRKFYSKSSLYRHILTHTGETHFACQFCERRFNVNTTKNRHEKTCRKNPKQKDKNWVEEQKVFKCQWCQYLCIDKASFHLHLRRHTGCKPVQCSQCSYGSASSAEVKQHSKRHVEDNPFKCAHCNWGFMSSTALKRHITCSHTDIFS